MAVRLILFDIDGTLLHCGPQVRRLFGEVLQEVFGQAGDLEEYDFRGKTDPQIVMDLQRGAGQSEDDVAARLPLFKRRYLELLEGRLERRKMRLLPAVVEVLEGLTRRAEVSVGLLTGNWEEGARIKLSRFDLNRFFAFGAFGDGQSRRHKLPRLALRKAAEATGEQFSPEETVIVGDSLLDVAAARACGIAAIAVATGGTPAEELASAGADWVIAHLGEAGACHPVFAAATRPDEKLGPDPASL